MSSPLIALVGEQTRLAFTAIDPEGEGVVAAPDRALSPALDFGAHRAGDVGHSYSVA
jgi:hypothetical protein